MSIERLFFTGFIVLAAMVALPFVTWWLYLLVRETKRRRAVREVARQFGYEFRSRIAGKLQDLAHFRLFANDSVLLRRSGLRIRNLVIHRSEDLVATIMDLQWHGCTSDEGFDPRERRTVVHVTADKLQLPEFDLRPNGTYLKLTSRFRCKVKIESHPEFARRYDLSGPEEEWIRELFHSDVLEMIEQEPRKFQFQGRVDGLIFFPVDQTIFGEGRLKPQDLPQLMQFATALGMQFLQAPFGVPIGADEAVDGVRLRSEVAGETCKAGDSRPTTPCESESSG